MTEFGRSFIFKVTGPQSVQRLTPLISEFGFSTIDVGCRDIDASFIKSPHLIWETTCEKAHRTMHKTAVVLNKLNNTHVIESKSSFAFLQLGMMAPSLQTYVASSAAEVSSWADRHWLSPSEDEEKDWWAVKASNGNGGKDIWIVNRDNYQSAVKELPPAEEYVIQR